MTCTTRSESNLQSSDLLRDLLGSALTVSPLIVIEVKKAHIKSSSINKNIKQCCILHTGKEVHGRGLAVLPYEIKTYENYSKGFFV